MYLFILLKIYFKEMCYLENNEKVKKSLAREIMEWIVCIVSAVTVAVLIKHYIFTFTLVQQGSMTPTILDGERVVINRLSRTFNYELKRGDIVTFEAPSSVDYDNGVAMYNEGTGIINVLWHDMLEFGKKSYIKRVVGLPGDHVYIDTDGSVYLNGELLNEEYLNGVKTPRNGDFYEVIVPDGYFFAMGDNRAGSMDCRAFGCVPFEKMEGTVSFRFWPFTRWGNIDS